MECCNWDTKKFFLFGARVFFGIWLLYLGAAKWIFFGAPGFVGYITQEFSATWSPPLLNTFLAWMIIIAEPLLALWILSGHKPRQAWMSSALLMFALVFGQTMLMKYDVVANNWQYLILCLVCAAMSDKDASCCGTVKSCS